MKTKIFATVGVLLLAALLLTMPVSADVTTISSQLGGVPSTFSMTMAPGDHTINLAIGDNLKDLNSIVVTSNSAWTLKAVDQMLGTPAKPALSAGGMAQFTPSGWGSKYLENKIQLGYNNGALVALSGTDTVIYTGIPEVHSANLKMKQIVTATDSVLPATDKYVIGIIVTGAATV